MPRINYAIDLETGMVVSRVRNEMAYPMLDYAGMKQENGYAINYTLEKLSVFHVDFNQLKFTKKIPMDEMNRHREFWGMKKLTKETTWNKVK